MFVQTQVESNYSPPLSLSGSPKEKVCIVPRNTQRPPKYFQSVGDLRSVQEIPSSYRHIFSSYPCFNNVQSKVMNDVLYSDKSLIVSAPTGSGKTVIFELAIVRFLLMLEDLNYNGDFKIVYVAPIKALCSERLNDWHQKFSILGLKCLELTGDTDYFEFCQLQSWNIIITTPEKWDSVTRKWRDNSHLVEVIKLFLLDEIHILNEDRRGPTLEAIVSRMRTIQSTILQEKRQHRISGEASKSYSIPPGIRFVAISATIPNIDDIACWLGSPTEPALKHKMSDNMRPVTLQRIVLGFHCPPSLTSYKFDLSLNYKLWGIIKKYSSCKPTLIFTSTRTSTKQTAMILKKDITVNFTEDQKIILTSASINLMEIGLKETVVAGIGYHHAGLSAQDKIIVETLFRNGHLPVLVSTNSLAMGVNLPAHLVIIKGTTQYQAGVEVQYPDCTVLQMMGRAGRPQFDTHAKAIIMTSNKYQDHYKRLVDGSELIESWLHKRLAEHLNAEVVLGTITDLPGAMQWIQTTFLYVRAVKNPRHYGLAPGLSRDKVEKKLEELCLVEMNALSRNGLIELEQEYGMNVTPTPFGHLMARYYLHFKTIKLFKDVKGYETIGDLLDIISQCQEFEDLHLRVTDKKTLNTLNRCKGTETIRFPITGLIRSVDKKVNCIIQAVLGCLPIQEASLYQESAKILRIADRVMKCLCDYLILKSGYFTALLNSLLLSKCINTKLWENSRHIARQLPGIGHAYSGLLVNSGKTTFRAILESNPRDLERIIGKHPPFGDELMKAVRQLPRFNITLCLEGKTAVKVKITLQNNDYVKSITMCLLVGDSKNNVLNYDANIKYKSFPNAWAYEKIITLKLSETHEIFAHLICLQWVGLDVGCSLKYLNSERHSRHIIASSTDIQNASKVQTKTDPIKPKSKFDQIHELCVNRIADVVPGRISLDTSNRSNELNLEKYLFIPQGPKIMIEKNINNGNMNSNKGYSKENISQRLPNVEKSLLSKTVPENGDQKTNEINIFEKNIKNSQPAVKTSTANHNVKWKDPIATLFTDESNSDTHKIDDLLYKAKNNNSKHNTNSKLMIPRTMTQTDFTIDFAEKNKTQPQQNQYNSKLNEDPLEILANKNKIYDSQIKSNLINENNADIKTNVSAIRSYKFSGESRKRRLSTENAIIKCYTNTSKQCYRNNENNLPVPRNNKKLDIGIEEVIRQLFELHSKTDCTTQLMIPDVEDTSQSVPNNGKLMHNKISIDFNPKTLNAHFLNTQHKTINNNNNSDIRTLSSGVLHSIRTRSNEDYDNCNAIMDNPLPEDKNYNVRKPIDNYEDLSPFEFNEIDNNNFESNLQDDKIENLNVYDLDNHNWHNPVNTNYYNDDNETNIYDPFELNLLDDYSNLNQQENERTTTSNINLHNSHLRNYTKQDSDTETYDPLELNEIDSCTNSNHRENQRTNSSNIYDNSIFYNSQQRNYRSLDSEIKTCDPRQRNNFFEQSERYFNEPDYNLNRFQKKSELNSQKSDSSKSGYMPREFTNFYLNTNDEPNQPTFNFNKDIVKSEKRNKHKVTTTKSMDLCLEAINKYMNRDS